MCADVGVLVEGVGPRHEWRRRSFEGPTRPAPRVPWGCEPVTHPERKGQRGVWTSRSSSDGRETHKLTGCLAACVFGRLGVRGGSTLCLGSRGRSFVMDPEGKQVGPTKDGGPVAPERKVTSECHRSYTVQGVSLVPGTPECMGQKLAVLGCSPRGNEGHRSAPGDGYRSPRLSSGEVGHP